MYKILLNLANTKFHPYKLRLGEISFRNSVLLRQDLQYMTSTQGHSHPKISEEGGDMDTQVGAQILTNTNTNIYGK